jgi:hypothetical protein
MVEGGPGDAHDLGDGSPGDLLLQEHPDFLLLAVKLGRSQRPFGAAEQATLGSGGGKPFLGPLGDLDRDQVRISRWDIRRGPPIVNKNSA